MAVPRAESSHASAMAAYRVGKVDFQTLLLSVLDLQNLRREYYRSLSKLATLHAGAVLALAVPIAYELIPSSLQSGSHPSVGN
jgi:hypothetical protein